MMTDTMRGITDHEHATTALAVAGGLIVGAALVWAWKSKPCGCTEAHGETDG